MLKRPNWDEYFLQIAKDISMRATCLRRRFGAVIINKETHKIISTGYCGNASKTKDCLELNECYREKMKIPSGMLYDLCNSIHAEENAIVQAAKFGMSVDGATIYSNMVPCFTCAKMIINSGIKRVVARYRYHSDGDSVEMFNISGVKLDVVNDKILDYPNQK